MLLWKLLLLLHVMMLLLQVMMLLLLLLLRLHLMDRRRRGETPGRHGGGRRAGSRGGLISRGRAWTVLHLERVELLSLDPSVLQSHSAGGVRYGAHLSVRRRQGVPGGVVEAVEDPVDPVPDLPELRLDVLGGNSLE